MARIITTFAQIIVKIQDFDRLHAKRLGFNDLPSKNLFLLVNGSLLRELLPKAVESGLASSSKDQWMKYDFKFFSTVINAREASKIFTHAEWIFDQASGITLSPSETKNKVYLWIMYSLNDKGYSPARISLRYELSFADLNRLMNAAMNKDVFNFNLSY